MTLYYHLQVVPNSHVHAQRLSSWTERPHGLQHTRFLCPCNFPGKNTGVGCHFLFKGSSGSHRLHYKYSPLISTKSLIFKIKSGVFPGGTVDRNPPANAGDTGSICDRRRFHMPSSNGTHVPQPLSLHSRACKLHILSLRAVTTEAYMPQSLCSSIGETTSMRSPWTSMKRKPSCSNEDPVQPKSKRDKQIIF